MNIDTCMRMNGYYELVRWLFLFPVLLPIVLLGRICKPGCSVPEEKEELTQHASWVAPSLDDSRYSALHCGYWQDDGTIITDASLCHIWYDDHLHELEPKRLYNIIRAMDKGHWANGGSVIIKPGLEAALRKEGLRRKVMDKAAQYEAENRAYWKRYCV